MQLATLQLYLSLQVNYIFEIEDSIPFLRKFSFIDTSIRRSTGTKLDDITQKEFQDRNNAVIDEIKVISDNHATHDIVRVCLC